MSGRRTFALSSDGFAGRTGRGIRIAIIDSGIHATHPHVGGVRGGIHLTPDATDNDIVDRLGHGTAVAAAIHEKAPDAELLVVRVFDRTLATSADVLARAIEWSSEQGARLINLSLGSPNPAHAERLAQAVQSATNRGAIVVAARDPDARVLLPGTLQGVVGVMVDWKADRDTLALVESGDGDTDAVLVASAYPRPIPGVPPERNLKGLSFAVANATGFLARWLEGTAGAGCRSAGEIFLMIGRREDEKTRGTEDEL
jgi:subtilisin family serine protease